MLKIKQLFKNKSLLSLFFLSLLVLTACDSPERGIAKISYSFDFPGAENTRQKPGARDLSGDTTDITSIILNIENINGEAITSETITPEKKQISLTVPTGIQLFVIGEAFNGETLRYRGSTSIPPLLAGATQSVSFFMYDSDDIPIQVDIGLANKPADGPSTGASFSPSRNYVLFTSAASNLVDADNNGGTDLFLRDLNTNSIINLHSSSSGEFGNSSDALNIAETDISADGRYVVFTSNASNLVPGDTNGVSDIFLKDTLNGQTQRVSLVNGVSQAPLASSQPDISSDGRFIIFFSEANLTGDGGDRLFIYDRITKKLVSSISGAQNPRLSGDGTYFVFVDTLTNSLQLYNTINRSRIAIVSISQTATTEKPILASSDSLARFKTDNATSQHFEYAINKNGRYVAFISSQSADEVEKGHVYLFDRDEKLVQRLSESKEETPLPISNTALRHPGLNDDGRYAVFQFNNTIYLKALTSGDLTAIADGSSPFISLSGSRIGYSDTQGRLMLQDNPLFEEFVGVASQIKLPPSQVKAVLQPDLSGITISWLPVDNSAYYRIYVATESGITPENIFDKANAIPNESIDESITIPIDFDAGDFVYAIVTSINEDGESQPSEEISAPLPLKIESVSPANGAKNISVDSPVIVRFNRAINADSITNETFIVSENNGPIEGEFGFPNPYSIQFKPSGPLGFGQDYLIQVSDLVAGKNGALLRESFSSSFTTPFRVDIDAGTGGSVNPSTMQTVNDRTTTSFELTPDTGFGIGSVTGCSGSLDGNIYTTGEITENCTVSVNFTDIVFSIGIDAGPGGTITPGENQTIFYGSSAKFTLTPTLGYHIKSVNGCSGILTDNIFTTAAVFANCDITATFEIDTFKLSYTAGANGSLSGSTSQSVNYGTNSTTVTAIPNTGYHFVNWSDGLTSASRTDMGITSNISVTAIFAIDTFTISTKASSGGSVSPNSTQTVDYGSTRQYTLTPSTGFHIGSVSGCDGFLSKNIFTTGEITANCTVTVNFDIDTFTIDISKTGSGTINPSVTQTVNYNGITQYTLTPSSGYHIGSVSGCSGTLSKNIFTTGQITANCIVNVNFVINTYTVNVNKTGSGTTSPSVAQTVSYNGTTKFTLTPGTGYHIGSVSGCDGTLAGNIFTTGAITSNCTVTANFTIDTFNLNYTATSGGSLSGNPSQTINYNGSGTTVTAIPNTGLHFVNWSDGLTTASRTDSNVKNNITVNANFAINTYNVSISTSTGGSVTPSSTQIVDYGFTTKFALTPDPGFLIGSVSGCGGILFDNIYTTEAITTDCTVFVSFILRNTPPIITSPNTASGSEFDTLVTKITASDTGSDPITFKISGGADQKLFTINAASGLLSFNTQASYETPLDADKNNIYDVWITANDGTFDSQTLKLLVTVINVKPINDTGVTLCSDTQNRLKCPLAAFPGQDAEFGRDFTVNNNSDGHAGFNFTKLDSKGSPLPASATSWTCVRDNVTGAVWQALNTSSVNWTYNWNEALNQVKTTNTNGLCGYKDWRLPTVTELISIIDYSANNPAIDTTWLPNTIGGYYWSSSEAVNDSTRAWDVQFATGSMFEDYKTTRLFVRLVRGN